MVSKIVRMTKRCFFKITIYSNLIFETNSCDSKNVKKVSNKWILDFQLLIKKNQNKYSKFNSSNSMSYIIWLTLTNSSLLVRKIAFFQLFITIFRSCCWRLRKNKRMILVHYIGKCCHGVNIVHNLHRSSIWSKWLTVPKRKTLAQLP